MTQRTFDYMRKMFRIPIAMACAAGSLRSWEQFQWKAAKWNEDDNRLIASVREEAYKKIRSIRSTHYSSVPKNETVTEGTAHLRKYDKAFLLIGAPVEDEVEQEEETLTLSENAAKEALIFEFMNHCKLHPELKYLKFPSLDGLNHRSNTHFASKFDIGETRYFLQLCSVYTYDEMKEIVKRFMKNCGGHAAVAHVYFNGHGAELGKLKAQLVFKECMRNNQDLETVQADLSEILNESNKFGILKKMHLFFCQCYGHQHHKTEDDRIDIIHFTSDDHPYTWFEYDFEIEELECDQIMSVKDSHHLEMEDYARKLEQGVKDMKILAMCDVSKMFSEYCKSTNFGSYKIWRFSE